MMRFLKAKLVKVMWCALTVTLLLLPSTARPMDGELTHVRMPNGLDVFVREDHSRHVAAIQLWVKVGAAYENDSEHGISHVIEHMAFKGTHRRGVGQIAKEVEEIGGRINAYTSWDETVFHIVVPSPATARGIDIVTDAVFRSTIDPAELEKEKKVVLEEILEDKDRPSDVASNLLFETAYVKSPYRFPVIGRKEIVQKITRQDIINFRKKWYVPENMFLVVVGDVDPTAVVKDVQRFTSDVKPTGFFRKPLPQEPSQKAIRGSVVRDPSATETRLNIAFHIPSMKGNDVNALDLAADILGARDDSRLVKVLKQEKGIVNAISAYSLTLKEPGLFVVSATLASKNLAAATKGVMGEVTRLAVTPPSTPELKEAKISIESDNVYEGETVQGMARMMGSYQNTLEDASYQEKYLTLNRAVTPEQVRRAAAKYLLPPNVTVSVLLPEKESRDFRIEQLERIIGDVGTSARKAAQGPALSKQTLYRKLENGIRVILVPDSSVPVISFRIACLGGKRFENKEDQGIMHFISSTLTKGAGNLTEFEIARKVYDMGGSLEGFSGNDSFGMYASFFSRHWSEGLDLLSQVYKDPSFPQDKVARQRDLILNSIKTEPDTPTTYVVNILYKTLFPDSPYGFDKLGIPATVKAFTADDLKREYHRFAVPSNTVIAAVGAMNTRKVLAKIEGLFGSIPPKELQAPKIVAEKPLEKVRETVRHVPRAKAYILMGFRGTTWSDPDRYPLDVLDNILSGQGGRLFRTLRDVESLAYVVTSFFRPSLEPGIFGLYIACDARKADQAYEGLIEQVKLIQKAKVSDAELDRAINKLIGNHLISLQSSSDRAQQEALYTLYGLGYDFDPKYLRNIREVKAQDVLRVARKYLNLKRCAVVKILPEAKGAPKK